MANDAVTSEGPARPSGGRELVTIVMPVFNEAATLRASIGRLDSTNFPFPWELVVVDDGSSDGCTTQLDESWAPTAQRVVVIRLAVNRGKGAALRAGLEAGRGSILGVQDADLEYFPADIPGLVAPILEGDADVVFGIRGFDDVAYSRLYTLGNRMVSLVSSLILRRRVRDAYTCYKFFRAEALIPGMLTADGFDIEAELTVGLLSPASARYVEVPITYRARGRSEGKKIRGVDGVTAIVALVRARRRSRMLTRVDRADVPERP